MFRFVPLLAPFAAVLATASALMGCTEEVRLGRELSTPGAGASSPAGAASSQAGAAGSELLLGGAGGAGGAFIEAPPAVVQGDARDAGPCVPRPCAGSTRACGDCLDNDGDGSIDANDPECLGPCDDSESELESGIPVNVNGSCRVDCYFDRNAGSGDDGCNWSYRCDPVSVAPDYSPTGSAMCEYDAALASCDSTLDACATSCLPLTPNGCDCFGCCELPAGSGRFSWLGSGDEMRSCTPAPGCENPCDECELCVGKAVLPVSCSAGLGPTCPPGVRACDPSSFAGCGPLEYCITGCCVPLPT
jgi:hypothetical protein